MRRDKFRGLPRHGKTRSARSYRDKRPGICPAVRHPGSGWPSGAPKAAEEAALALVIIIFVVVIDGRRIRIDLERLQRMRQ